MIVGYFIIANLSETWILQQWSINMKQMFPNVHDMFSLQMSGGDEDLTVFERVEDGDNIEVEGMVDTVLLITFFSIFW